MEICRELKPPFFKVDADHEVACFLYEGHGEAPTAEAGAQ
jgi:hypothetical protein